MKKSILTLLLTSIGLFNVAFANIFTCPTQEVFAANYLHQHKVGDVVTIDGLEFTLYGSYAITPADLNKTYFVAADINTNSPSIDCSYQAEGGTLNYDMIDNDVAMQPSTRLNWAPTKIVPTTSGFICGFGNEPSFCSVNY